MKKRWFQSLSTYLLLLLVTGCVYVATSQLDQKYGTAKVRDRHVASTTTAPEYYRDIKPIVDNRCVVCHACYDAPCQLKLSAFEGIERGANKEEVYDGGRLMATGLTRLFVDAKTTGDWRKKDFYPVLNERNQLQEANLDGSVMYRMLDLKKQHPLPTSGVLPADDFDFKLDRDQQCPKIEEFDRFAVKYPQWGMPYGLPALNEREFTAIKQWLAMGAKATDRPAPDPAYQPLIERWEAFFNGDSLKQQLMSRYIYEHLFIGHLYFEAGNNQQFFNMVRSRTAPGQPIDVIHSRRPFDDPGVERVYYRLEPVKTTIVAKSHMPYLLNDARMSRWQELFLGDDYAVTTLPSYAPEVASNPFDAFMQLPVNSRYKFMLDEAQFTIMGFIKGPVCRGQIALNVINDHFWVVFTEPDAKNQQVTAAFLAEEVKNLSLPAANESNALPISTWIKYSKLESNFRSAKAKLLDELFPSNDAITLDLIWDGDKTNQNAALTIFRHFDSASVIKGLVGKKPKTAWVINYTLLERIHYLLVAGYDVYGNLGHQVNTRLYMDFLRMSGESNFIYFMPEPYGGKMLSSWYEGSESSIKDYITNIQSRDDGPIGIDYGNGDPMTEFFLLLAEKMGPQIIAPDPINRGINATNPELAQLQRLADIGGQILDYFPEAAILRINGSDGKGKLYSLIRNRSHSNVSSLLGEAKRLIPAEQNLTVVEGVVGNYPNSFFDVNQQQLGDFVDKIAAMNSDQSFTQLMSDYGVRRTNPQFWNYSDWVTDYYYKNRPIEAGLLDYNRYNNR